jgi:hypothetical protein
MMSFYEWLAILAGAALPPRLFGLLAAWLHARHVNRLIAEAERRIRCVHQGTHTAQERVDQLARRS